MLTLALIANVAFLIEFSDMLGLHKQFHFTKLTLLPKNGGSL